MGIALTLFGTGLAFFPGKPYVQPTAPRLPAIPLGLWSDLPQVRSALDVSPLFFLGLATALLMAWAFRATRPGLTVRIVGDSADAARAMGLPIERVRIAATAAGSALAGVGAALLFGAAGALGPSLQTVGVTHGYHLFYAAPYVLTLLIMVLTVSPGRTLSGVPGELSIVR